ncbi:MAG: quinate 5-dehydrogenase [bacterium]
METELKRRHVVSVSIGSSTRNHSIEADVMGVPFLIERIGTDGDKKKAIQMIRDFDGKIDAIGLGGIDLYVHVGQKKYMIKDAKTLYDAAKITPVYDGSILKNSIEKEFIAQLGREGRYLKNGTKVLLVSSADRFGMAEAFANAGCDMIYGDFIFSLNLKIPIKNLSVLRMVAKTLLPIFSQLPFEMIYPTGKEQLTRKPRHKEFFEWADVIAGDFNYINKYMPEDLRGKVIITNTVTSKDVEDMRKRKAATLITTTPDFGGRSFGTNVMEGVYATLLGKTRQDPPTEKDFREFVKKENLKPRVLQITE